jgi:hypothetical protein
MSTETYLEIYHYLINDKKIDVDEAQCILGDCEEAMLADKTLDAWEYIGSMM